MSTISPVGAGIVANNVFDHAHSHDPLREPDQSRPVPHDGDDLMMAPREDTRIDWGCIFGEGIFYVLDTGARGPDDVRITIHEDDSVTVEVNGRKYEFDAESARNLRVRVDDNDTVQVNDERAPLSKALDPEPVQVFSYPR